MTDGKFIERAKFVRLLNQTILSSPVIAVLMLSQQAHAQSGRVVSACSGVSLPRSVVTGIMSPVLTGITGPIEGAVNPLLGVLVPKLNIDVTGLLNQAAAGDPITLQVLARDGTVIGPTDDCRVSSDSITLDTPAGVAIGGNQITGLGANGTPAFASDINAIAFGNNARAEAGAVGSIAIGTNSSVTAANSVALGANSIAARGALAGYTVPGLTGPQNSAGEVSVGTPGALRQITNVAAGTADTDAATVGQVNGLLAQVNTIGTLAVQYDGATHDRITLSGAAGTTITNVAPGMLNGTSTDAVNGAQLFATNQAVAGNTTAITGLDTRVTGNTTAIAGLDTRVTSNTDAIADLDATAVRYDDASRGVVTFGGAGGTILANIAPGALTATSLQAVNGSQLFATNQNVAANTTAITNNSMAIVAANTLITDNTNAITALDAAAVQYDDAGHAMITLTGAGGTTIANLAPGALTANSTQAVNGSQLYTTNQNVAANMASITDINTRLTSTTNVLGVLDATAVRYDGADRGIVTFGGAGGTVLDNVAPGALTATSLQAVNGSQLFATNTQLAAVSLAVSQLGSGALGPVRYSSPATPTVPNNGTATDDLTLVAASGGPAGLHNVRDGALGVGSTDAVNGGQLYATNQAVAANTTAITGLDTRVTNNETQIANLTTNVTNNTTAITDLQNNVGTTNTNVSNLTTQVNGNTTAITNLQTAVANQPLHYADAASPTTPNTGAVTDDATLAGASGGAVGLHNVRGGVVAAGSSDAVNGDQLFATNTQVAANTTAITNLSNVVAGSGVVSAVQYSNAGTPNMPNGGVVTNDVTLVGADAAAPVSVHNVAAGAMTTTSTDAVNGAQLYATNQVAQQAAALGANSVQYDPGPYIGDFHRHQCERCRAS